MTRTARHRSPCDHLAAQVQPHPQHHATRINEGSAKTEVGAEEIVCGQTLLRRVIQCIEDVQQQLDTRVDPPGEIIRDTRRSTSVCDDSRREPRGSSRMRVWSPCGSAICALAAHGLPLKCCTLAATSNPVFGTATLPIPRNMCGRSFGGRPRAFVRLLRSCPNVRHRCAGDRADLRAGGARSARGLQPRRARPGVRTKRLPPFGLPFVDRQHQAVVLERYPCRIRQQKPAIGRGVHEYVHWQASTIWQRSRFLAILATHISPTDEVPAILARVAKSMTPTRHPFAASAAIRPLCPAAPSLS